jgi:lipopolysaccharide exporter
MEYKKEAVKGVSWIGFLRITTKIFGFVEAIILARILVPEQFGAYGVALLALGILEVFTESGVNIILVQEKDTDRFINSAWIISIMRGIVIMFILLMSAPFIAMFFNSSESLILLYLISLVPLVRGFINPAVVKLQKDLLFRKDFIFRLTVLLIDTLITVAVTYVTKSPIGIVIGLLIGVVTELILSFLIVSPRPKLVWQRSYLNNIFHRGKWVTASSIFDYLFYNADNIAVGKILGAGALGVYQLGYSLAVIPLSEVGKVFVHVTVPIFMRISADGPKLKKAFFNTIMSIMLITLPFALLFAFIPQFFLLLLGDKWFELSYILPILGVVGFVKAVSLAANALFLSMKKQEYTTIITFVNILGLVISIVPMISAYGMFGAGISALIGSAVAIPFIIYFTHRSFKLIST